MDASAATPGRDCPPWCDTSHGELQGEEDRVHLGPRVVLARGLAAQLCASDADGRLDGPYVIVTDLPEGLLGEGQVLEIPLQALLGGLYAGLIDARLRAVTGSQGPEECQR